MEEQTRTRPRHGVDHLVQRHGSLDLQHLRRTSGRGRVFLRASGEGREQSRPMRRSAGAGDTHAQARERVRVPGAPQQPGGFLQRRVLGPLGHVAAAIVEPPVRDQADRRPDHALALHRRLERHDHARRLARARALQPRHIGGGIEAAARIVGVGSGGDPPPADIGVEGLGLDPQQRQDLGAGDPSIRRLSVPLANAWRHRCKSPSPHGESARTLGRFDDRKPNGGS